jgi:hypothetical protein
VIILRRRHLVHVLQAYSFGYFNASRPHLTQSQVSLPVYVTVKLPHDNTGPAESAAPASRPVSHLVIP